MSTTKNYCNYFALFSKCFASKNWGVLYDGNNIYNSAVREVTPVVDRVGSGDAFMGGLIYGLLEYGNDLQKALDFAVTACCLKHSIAGDYNLVTLKEVQDRLDGNGAALVSR